VPDDNSPLAEGVETTPSPEPSSEALESAQQAIEDAIDSGASPDEIAQLRETLKAERDKFLRSENSYKGRWEQTRKDLAERDAKIQEALKEVSELKQWRQQQEIQSRQSQLDSEDRQFEQALRQYAQQREEEGYSREQIQTMLNAERLGYLNTKRKNELDQREKEILNRYGTDIASAKAVAYAERLADQTVAKARAKKVTIEVTPTEIMAKAKELYGRMPQDEREMEEVRLDMLFDKLLAADRSSKATTRRANLQADAESGAYEQETTGVADMSEKAVVDAFTNGTDDPRIIDAYMKIRQKRGLSYI
jgi:hypothetical protein